MRTDWTDIQLQRLTFSRYSVQQFFCCFRYNTHSIRWAYKTTRGKVVIISATFFRDSWIEYAMLEREVFDVGAAIDALPCAPTPTKTNKIEANKSLDVLHKYSIEKVIQQFVDLFSNYWLYIKTLLFMSY